MLDVREDYHGGEDEDEAEEEEEGRGSDLLDLTSNTLSLTLHSFILFSLLLSFHLYN